MQGEQLLSEDRARDDKLILVDALDREVGSTTKIRAHVDGLLHRAFSVVLFREGDEGPELLLTRRAAAKYHSGNLWANSCCSHPRVGETVVDAALRRIQEELGCSATNLKEITAFVYRAEFDNGLCEFEYDHVLVGHCLGEPDPDPNETSEIRWLDINELGIELSREPEKYTAWAPMVLSLALAQMYPTTLVEPKSAE